MQRSVFRFRRDKHMRGQEHYDGLPTFAVYALRRAWNHGWGGPGPSAGVLRTMTDADLLDLPGIGPTILAILRERFPYSPYSNDNDDADGWCEHAAMVTGRG